MSFNNITEKVNYIAQNQKELYQILLKDDALSTMLIDMINKKHGNNFPRTKILLTPENPPQ